MILDCNDLSISFQRLLNVSTFLFVQSKFSDLSFFVASLYFRDTMYFFVEIQILNFNIYNTIPGGIRSPEHSLKLERWQGPPYIKVKQ